MILGNRITVWQPRCATRSHARHPSRSLRSDTGIMRRKKIGLKAKEEIYNETLRPSPRGGHEGPAKATPHPSPIALVLHPILTVSRSSTRAIPERRASHRRDAFVGLQKKSEEPRKDRKEERVHVVLR
ncbi:hypothetical protein B0H19DRAFT_630504 [Mycena capillaripes]|nr:hypothetical protein B0H19DRAFT_630504 [Mycena capillaripes]